MEGSSNFENDQAFIGAMQLEGDGPQAKSNLLYSLFLFVSSTLAKVYPSQLYLTLATLAITLAVDTVVMRSVRLCRFDACE